MFRTWSSTNNDMTLRESTPTRRMTRAISLANDTLVAWKALQAYLSDSAVRGSTTLAGWSRKPNKLLTVSATTGSDVPITIIGALKKSSTEVPSRRNSGHMAAPAVIAVLASPLVSAGSTALSIVPGGTVLRMTTLWRSEAAGTARRSAATMSSTARRM